MKNNIPNFKCVIRWDISSLTTRLETTSNMLISAIEKCWLIKFVIWKPESLTSRYEIIILILLSSLVIHCVKIYHFNLIIIVYMYFYSMSAHA